MWNYDDMKCIPPKGVLYIIPKQGKICGRFVSNVPLQCSKSLRNDRKKCTKLDHIPHPTYHVGLPHHNSAEKDGKIPICINSPIIQKHLEHTYQCVANHICASDLEEKISPVAKKARFVLRWRKPW